jgi:hypothetical protein
VCSVLAQVCVFKIFVQVLLAHECVNIGKKNELELGKEHWHAKILSIIQKRTKNLVMTKRLVE